MVTMSFGLRPIPWAAKNLLAIWIISLASSPAFAQVQPAIGSATQLPTQLPIQPLIPQVVQSLGQHKVADQILSQPEFANSVYFDLHRELPSKSTATSPSTLASATISGTTNNLSIEQFAKSDTVLSQDSNTAQELRTAQEEPKISQEPKTVQESQLIPNSPGDNSLVNKRSESSESGESFDSNSMAPINLAQSVPTDVINENQQVDLVPTNIPRRTPAFNNFSGAHMNLLYRLPSKLFFSSVIENSLRLETNVFQTSPKESSDMIYRVFPNTTIGYEIAKNTQIYSNYFFLRDQYTAFSPLLNRNFHSIGFGINRNIPLSKNRGTVILGLQGRGLFATLDKFPGSFFNDYLPSITYQKGFANGQVIFASVFGQLRFREMAARFQEGDIFYTLGHIYRRGGWAFLNNFTLASNFGSQKIRQGPDTQIIILEHELSRQVSRKFPWLQTFIRAQEIFNMGAGNVPFTPGALDNAVYPGFSGVNCRVFAGIRTTFYKPVLETPKLNGR